MRCFLLITIFFSFLYGSVTGQIISQYIETSSGTTPKGIEIWNNTISELNFSTYNLVIGKGTNGAIPSPDFTISSGTLASGNAIVIGTTDMQTITETNGSVFYLKAFTFNGDDALVVKYGGVTTDVFGTPGSDPGTAWTGNGVITANQNIALLDGIESGDTDGWTDPSLRFKTISTDNSLSGFGIAPIRITGSLVVQPTQLNGFNYIFQQGPSISQSLTISGIGLSNEVVISPSSNFEISVDNINFQQTAITLSAQSVILSQISIYARLKAGLEIGRYFNEMLSVTSVGATEVSVTLNGRVNFSAEMQLPNAWINEFHYENIGTDVNEFLEIVIEKATLFDLEDFTVSLYNGGDGQVYDTESVNNFISGSANQDFNFYSWYPGSLENGSPDGFSINYKDEAILFLSYEGSFTATDGPATGIVSSDVYLAQSSTKTVIGHSLQLIGTGNQYSHFRWIDPPASPGIINTYQSLGNPIPPVPVDYRYILLAFSLISLKIICKKWRS